MKHTAILQLHYAAIAGGVGTPHFYTFGWPQEEGTAQRNSTAGNSSMVVKQLALVVAIEFSKVIRKVLGQRVGTGAIRLCCPWCRRISLL
jgi:hypothetical protein